MKKILKLSINYWPLICILMIYAGLMISVISWGVPNNNHPFLYHMDEWHFSQSIRAVVKHFTTTISGAGHIPFFHVISSMAFLSPFVLLKVIDPFLIKSSLANPGVQQTFFELLRLHTLLYGVLAIIFLFKILKENIKLPVVFTVLFAATPIWLVLGNYYKYDIALLFWIITALFFMLRFEKSQSKRDFLLAGLSSGLALATKFSAIPLLPIYFIAFILFSNKRKYKLMFHGLIIFLTTFLVIGIPDVLLGKGNYSELLSSNLVTGPAGTDNFNLGGSYLWFLAVGQFPALFGHALIIFFLLSLIYLTGLFVKNRKKLFRFKKELFIFTGFILFLASLVPLKLLVINRGLVLLPFIIILCGYAISHLVQKAAFKKSAIALLMIVLLLQIVESFTWVNLKWHDDPRSLSSRWAITNIPKGETIGLLNVPIYQMVPDLFLKEFYYKQYDLPNQNKYKYVIIDSSSSSLPRYVAVTNVDFDRNFIKVSDKKNLILRLEKSGYKEIVKFEPDWGYFKLFNSEENYIVSNILPMPTITIYKKL